jgi:hypothetical protein
VTDDLRVPTADMVDDKKIADVLREYARLQGERNAAHAAVQDLEASRGAAAEADRPASADALRRGEPDPGDVRTREAEAEIADAQRRADALSVAARDAGWELVATVERQRATWASKLDRRGEAARRAIGDAVDALAVAHDTLDEVLSLRGWPSEFPGGKWPRKYLGHTPGLLQPKGSPHSTADVLTALRRLAERPEPAKPAATTTPLRVAG